MYVCVFSAMKEWLKACVPLCLCRCFMMMIVAVFGS